MYRIALPGRGLPGVSVVVEGTKRGTVTDANGNFRINASPNEVLVVSFLGYRSQNVRVRGGGAINVTLAAQTNQLTDVVVIGYGTRQRKDVTGAISTVDAKDIEKSTSVTAELALQGRAAGVFVSAGGGDPQARPTIRIRGVNTFGFAEPLYVVDGVPMFEGGAGVTEGAIGDIRSPVNIFSMINPNDIESITVLKDASSAAIYGVRASNGVILITTKKGKAGRPRVDIASSYGVQNIRKTYPVLNTQQYFGLVREAYNANPDANTTFEQKFGPSVRSSKSAVCR
jgi:TonB-dependent SusC/RagA subfamily outer membrane receptor